MDASLPSWYRPLSHTTDGSVLDPDWARLPKTYAYLPGEYYFIGQLAEALNRTPGTLRRWIRQGWLPEAPEFADGVAEPGGSPDARGDRRLFTFDQIQSAVRIAAEEGLLETQRCCPANTDFPDRVAEEWAGLPSRPSSMPARDELTPHTGRHTVTPWPELMSQPQPRQTWLLPPQR